MSVGDPRLKRYTYVVYRPRADLVLELVHDDMAHGAVGSLAVCRCDAQRIEKSETDQTTNADGDCDGLVNAAM